MDDWQQHPIPRPITPPPPYEQVAHKKIYRTTDSPPSYDTAMAAMQSYGYVWLGINKFHSRCTNCSSFMKLMFLRSVWLLKRNSQGCVLMPRLKHTLHLLVNAAVPCLWITTTNWSAECPSVSWIWQVLNRRNVYLTSWVEEIFVTTVN